MYDCDDQTGVSSAPHDRSEKCNRRAYQRIPGVREISQNREYYHEDTVSPKAVSGHIKARSFSSRNITRVQRHWQVPRTIDSLDGHGKGEHKHHGDAQQEDGCCVSPDGVQHHLQLLAKADQEACPNQRHDHADDVEYCRNGHVNESLQKFILLGAYVQTR